MTDREEFEEAMRRVYGKGMPDAEEMQWAWQGWQAARAAPAQPCPFGCTTQEEHDAHYAPAQPACPDALLPDGPVCPRCGKRRGPSGIDGGSWVHYWPEEDDGIPKT